MNLRVIIVEPLYQINLGYIARIAKNFGVRELIIIKPRCQVKGKEALKYSKHAADLLSNAKVTESLSDAIAGTFVIGTTALPEKTGSAFHNIFTVDETIKMLEKNKAKAASLLIGRDDTGLSKDEIKKCDAVISIETPGEYSSLNISHALAILLYEFTNKLGVNKKYLKRSAENEDVEQVIRLFRKLISGRKDIRKKKDVEMAFSHVVKRACPTKKELAAISIAISFRMNRK